MRLRRKTSPVIDLDDRSLRSAPAQRAQPAQPAHPVWPAIGMAAYDEALDRVGATAADPRPAYTGLRVTLREVCRLADFALGHVYLVHPCGHLLPAAIWEGTGSGRFGRFVRASMGTVLLPGIGLPGRAAATRRPAAIAALAGDDAARPRAAAGVADGLRSAFAFPVLQDAAAIAVLEFFALQPRPPDPHVTALLGGLVDVVAPMLVSQDGAELLEHEAAAAAAAGVLVPRHRAHDEHVPKRSTVCRTS